MRRKPAPANTLSGGSSVVSKIAPFVSEEAAPKAGKPGALDSSFPLIGLLSAGQSADTRQISAVELQKDERIVVAGQTWNTPATGAFFVKRYLSTGKADTSFGQDGLVVTWFGNQTTTSLSAGGLALQLDGKIVVTGASYDP